MIHSRGERGGRRWGPKNGPRTGGAPAGPAQGWALPWPAGHILLRGKCWEFLGKAKFMALSRG